MTHILKAVFTTPILKTLLTAPSAGDLIADPSGPWGRRCSKSPHQIVQLLSMLAQTRSQNVMFDMSMARLGGCELKTAECVFVVSPKCLRSRRARDDRPPHRAGFWTGNKRRTAHTHTHTHRVNVARKILETKTPKDRRRRGPSRGPAKRGSPKSRQP